ncbi:hypothetical protein B0H13DRAFT_1899376 [Mycena leptocephala]|nr:hypothetical protein B0H13DRAFT_1899376 [Mycena leptocephala]
MGVNNENYYNAIPTLKYLRRALGGQGTGITRHRQRWARPMSTVKPSRHRIVRVAPKRPRVAGSAEVQISISTPNGVLAGKKMGLLILVEEAMGAGNNCQLNSWHLQSGVGVLKAGAIQLRNQISNFGRQSKDSRERRYDHEESRPDTEELVWSRLEGKDEEGHGEVQASGSKAKLSTDRRRMYGFDVVYGRIFDGYYGIRDGICRTVKSEPESSPIARQPEQECACWGWGRVTKAGQEEDGGV